LLTLKQKKRAALGLWSGAELKAQNLNYETKIIRSTKVG
jgi:hypothetical protein